MADTHHTAKGMKKKLAYDLMWLAMCIENVERLGHFKIPYPKISQIAEKAFSRKLNWAKALRDIVVLLQSALSFMTHFESVAPLLSSCIALQKHQYHYGLHLLHQLD